MRSNETLFPKKLLQGEPCSVTSREKELSVSTYLYSLTQCSTSHLMNCCVFFFFPSSPSFLIAGFIFFPFFRSTFPLPCFPSPLTSHISPPHLPLFTALLHHPVFLCLSLSQSFAGLHLVFVEVPPAAAECR